MKCSQRNVQVKTHLFLHDYTSTIQQYSSRRSSQLSLPLLSLFTGWVVTFSAMVGVFSRQAEGEHRLTEVCGNLSDGAEVRTTVKTTRLFAIEFLLMSLWGSALSLHPPQSLHWHGRWLRVHNFKHISTNHAADLCSWLMIS